MTGSLLGLAIAYGQLENGARGNMWHGIRAHDVQIQSSHHPSTPSAPTTPQVLSPRACPPRLAGGAVRGLCVAFVLLFVAFFSFSWGPISWIIPS